MALRVVFRDMRGVERPMRPRLDGYRDLSFSPDGTRLAYAAFPEGSNASDVCVHDFRRDVSSRLTCSPSLEWRPICSPDGQHLLYCVVGSGIHRMRVDGSVEPDVLVKGHWLVPGSISRDGRHLAYHD